MSEQSHPDELIANPDKYFDGPKDVLDRASLSRERKLAILRAMKQGVQEQSAAANPRAPAAPGKRLKAITDAIRAVERDRPA